MRLKPKMSRHKSLISVIIFGCIFLISCNKTPEPNEYVTSLDRFFSFSEKGVLKTNNKIESAILRGFADFNGDKIEDIFEVRDIDLSKANFEIWIYEGYLDVETKLINYSDPYSIETEWDADKKWGDNLEIDTADVNGDGFADIILSEYTELWNKDEFNLAVSLNKGLDRSTRNITFRWINKIFDEKSNGSFNKSFLNFINEREAESNDFCFGNTCSIRDHFRLKWADMDNSGTDDLVVLWRETRDDINLFVKVFRTNAPTPSKIFQQLTFSYHENFFFPKIFAGDYRNFFRLGKIDIGDFNNDGLGDLIFVAEKSDERVLLKFAINTSSLRRYDGISFMTDASTQYPEIDWNLLTKVSDKINIVDLNMDGCSDYAHIGESSAFSGNPSGKETKNIKSIYYMLTDCAKAKSVLSNLKFSKELIGIQWPDDHVPKEKEKVVAIPMSGIKNN